VRARDDRKRAIALAEEAQRSPTAKQKRTCETRARIQWAKVDAVVSLDELGLNEWSRVARSQNKALRGNQGNAHHDVLDLVGEVLLLEAEADNGQGITDEAANVVRRIRTDFDRARIAPRLAAPRFLFQDAIQKRLPRLANARAGGKQPANPKKHKPTSVTKTRKPLRHRRSSAGAVGVSVASTHFVTGLD